ncbi:MAG: alpha/beta hydrolase-fold protein [Pirellulaceae bacterium]|nr:alpha/beta hydrolase-fold protein [Pirellulaceae bacterium]
MGHLWGVHRMRGWANKAVWIGPLRAGIIVALIGLGGLGTSGLAAETITLKNGMVIEGSFDKLSVIGANPLGGNGPKQILLCDDQLRRIFVGTNQVATAPAPKPATTIDKFNIPQRVAVAGRHVGSVGPIVRVTPFDEWGRRIFSMNSTEGIIDIVQGITEITPTWTKVEAIQGADSYIWTMKIATSSIPRETLNKILYHHIKPDKSEDRLKVVRFYVQSERVQDARAEIAQAIADFPDLAALRPVADSLTQMAANRLIKEIELRRDAGQPALAIAMLDRFPGDGVAGETLLKVRDMLADFRAQEQSGQELMQALDAQLALVKDDKARAELTPIITEIKSNLTYHTIDRLADFSRLGGDAALSPEQKLSLAISGWLLGSGAGLDNLAVSKSLVEVRDLVRQYLLSKRKPERDAILTKLSSLEGGTPAYLAKLIAHMKPPLDATPAAFVPVDPGDLEAVLGPKAPAAAGPAPAGGAAVPAAPPAADPKPCDDEGDKGDADKKGGLLDAPALPKLPVPGIKKPADPVPVAVAVDPKPAAPISTGIPGFFELTTTGLPEEPEIKYCVQLPPEYSPYRRYPCVVTLCGSATTPQQQIDWWAGQFNPEPKARYGQATRHGYIVIAPKWNREHQRKYEYTAREHAAALYSLRDASKRFAIDTDRVFLSGHSMGGDAAWDIGLAHPDVWAGVIPIVATADKYVTRYWENAAYCSFYFVCGEKDSNKLALNSVDWDRYLRHTGYDTMIVQYQGRGHEHFHDEVQEIFKWMNLHVRNFFPREYTTYTMRPWDSFFWFADVSKLPPASIVLPAEWPKTATPCKVDVQVLTSNAVRVTTGADKVTVWLAPEIVNFESKVTVTINGRRQLNITPSNQVLLEDVRTRGDRQHPFWAKAEN